MPSTSDHRPHRNPAPNPTLFLTLTDYDLNPNPNPNPSFSSIQARLAKKLSKVPLSGLRLNVIMSPVKLRREQTIKGLIHPNHRPEVSLWRAG